MRRAEDLNRLLNASEDAETRSSIGFNALVERSRKSVLSLLPAESSAEEGVRFQLYTNRFREVTGLEPAMLEERRSRSLIFSGGGTP